MGRQIRFQGFKYIYSLQGKYINGRLQTLDVGSLFSTSIIARDMAGITASEKCNYHQGCISAKKELVRMGQSITYKDNTGQVKSSSIHSVSCLFKAHKNLKNYDVLIIIVFLHITFSQDSCWPV